MRRDIAVQKVNEPLVGSASGFSNANFQATPENVFNPMDVIAEFTGSVQGIMGEANANAFKQGQADQAADMMAMGNTVDSAAALIDNASWATKESYSQGVKYQQYAEGQLETQQEILIQAQKSADKGEPVEVFTQKVKPTLARLNQQINDLGLEGKAREDAQQQMIGYVVAAQEQYQKQREAVIETNYNTAINQTSAAGLQNLLATEGALESSRSFGDQVLAIYNIANQYSPVKAADTTGKQAQALLTSALANLNPASEVDMERVAGYAAYLRTDDSILLPADARQRMLSSITESQNKFRSVNAITVGNQLRGLETQYASTGAVSQDSMQGTASTVMRMLQKNQITPETANSSLDRLNKLGLKMDKEMGLEQNISTANADERRVLGIPDKDQTNVWQKQFTKRAYAAGKPEMAGSLTVEAGRQKQNYIAVEAGHKQLSGNYVSALTMNPAEYEAYADKGLAQRSFAEDRRLATDAMLTNDPISASFQMKAWSSTLGAQGAGAMETLMLDPSVQSLEDVQARYPIVLQQIKDNEAAGKMGNVTISEDTLTSPMWGQLFGISSTLGAALGKGADENIMGVKRVQLQRLYNANKGYLIDKHNIKSDDGGASALKAMVAEGLIVRTDYGVTMMDQKTRFILGNGSYASADTVNRIDTALRERAVLELGPGAAASPENIQIKYTGANATVQVYTDNTFSADSLIKVIHIPMDELRTMTRASFNEDTQEVRPIGQIPVPVGKGVLTSDKSSTVYADNGTFGSNGFKQAALQRIANDEGYLSNVTSPEPGVELVGHSVSKKTYVGFFGEDKWNEFVTAAKNPYGKAYGKLYDEFTNKYFERMPELIAESGLQVKTIGSNLPLEVLASTYYHGNESGWTYAKALRTANEGNLKQAVDMVQKTAAYKEAGNTRKKEMLDGLAAVR